MDGETETEIVSFSLKFVRIFIFPCSGREFPRRYDAEVHKFLRGIVVTCEFLGAVRLSAARRFLKIVYLYFDCPSLIVCGKMISIERILLRVFFFSTPLCSIHTVFFNCITQQAKNSCHEICNSERIFNPENNAVGRFSLANHISEYWTIENLM